MRNPVTPAMATAGAKMLAALPWSGEVTDPAHLARHVFGVMDAQRVRDELALVAQRRAARAAVNTPWNTPSSRETA